MRHAEAGKRFPPQWSGRRKSPWGGHDLGRHSGPRKTWDRRRTRRIRKRWERTPVGPVLEGDLRVRHRGSSDAPRTRDGPAATVGASWCDGPTQGWPRCLGEHRGRAPPGRCVPWCSAAPRPFGSAGTTVCRGVPGLLDALGPTSLRGPSAPARAARSGRARGGRKPAGDGGWGERTKAPVPGRRSGRRVSARPKSRVYSNTETEHPGHDRTAEPDRGTGRRVTPGERLAHRIELRRSDMTVTKKCIPRESLIERC